MAPVAADRTPLYRRLLALRSVVRAVVELSAGRSAQLVVDPSGVCSLRSGRLSPGQFRPRLGCAWGLARTSSPTQTYLQLLHQTALSEGHLLSLPVRARLVQPRVSVAVSGTCLAFRTTKGVVDLQL